MHNSSSGNPQAKLLLLCTRAKESFENDSIRRIQIKEASSRCENWENLIELAQSNSIVPNVYLALNQICPEVIPKQVLVSLREAFISTAWINLELTAELLRLLDICQSHGITAVPYKGPVIAANGYGDLSFREFGDLDILIRRKDLNPMKDILLANGYRAVINFNQKLESLYFRSKCECAFQNKERGSIVEIHWTPVPTYFADIGHIQQYLDRIEKDIIGSTKISTFCPEDLLIVLSVHGARHLWHSLKWICDLDRVIRINPELDWEAIVDIAKKCSISRMVYSGLLLASSLLYSPIPEHILVKCNNDPKTKTLATLFDSQLFLTSRKYGEGFWTNRIRTKLLERRRDKIRYTLGMIFRLSEDDVTWIKLPQWCYPSYYLLRPVNLTRRYGQRLYHKFKTLIFSGNLSK